MKYDVDYFLKKFDAIPEDDWCAGAFADSNGRHCAYGHCGVYEVKEEGCITEISTSEGDQLEAMFESSGMHAHLVNDGDTPAYQQPTPKQRILAALHDIKAKQEAKP